MPLNEPLPANQPQLVFLGVRSATAKTRAFALTGEAILHGNRHLQAEPDAVPGDPAGARAERDSSKWSKPTGQTTTYELKLVSISKSRERIRLAAQAHGGPRACRRRRRRTLR